MLFSAGNKNNAALSQKIFDRIHLLFYNHKASVTSATVLLANTDGETNESVLWGHSERIAFAFQLIQEPEPSIIQIVNNRQICGDCRKSLFNL